MKARTSASLWVAGMLVLGGAAASAQSAGQPPAPPSQPPAAPQSQPPAPQPQPSARPSSDQEMTITGCIQKEADFRAAKDAGKGGAAGTGAGAGNEFILAQASAASAADPAMPTGTSGSAAAYELTGPNEGQVSQFVGKRVEIKGKVKAAETSASGRPTGGATAGAPPAGVDVASKDLKLRELEITSVKEASGSCAPAR